MQQQLTLREISACIVTAGAAIIVIGVMPILAGLFVEQFKLTLDQVGWVLSTESIGIGVGSAVSVRGSAPAPRITILRKSSRA